MKYFLLKLFKTCIYSHFSLYEWNLTTTHILMFCELHYSAKDAFNECKIWGHHPCDLEGNDLAISK